MTSPILLIILATIFIVTVIGDSKRRLKYKSESASLHAEQRALLHKIMGTG